MWLNKMDRVRLARNAAVRVAKSQFEPDQEDRAHPG